MVLIKHIQHRNYVQKLLFYVSNLASRFDSAFLIKSFGLKFLYLPKGFATFLLSRFYIPFHHHYVFYNFKSAFVYTSMFHSICTTGPNYFIANLVWQVGQNINLYTLSLYSQKCNRMQSYGSF